MSSLTTLGNQSVGLVRDSSQLRRSLQSISWTTRPHPLGRSGQSFEAAKALGEDVTMTKAKPLASEVWDYNLGSAVSSHLTSDPFLPFSEMQFLQQ